MKKFLFFAVCLTLFAFHSFADSSMSENGTAAKTLVMEASWKQGDSGRAWINKPKKNLIQFSDTEEAAAPANAEIVSPESTACLFCHDYTFEALAVRTADYKDAWGEPVNPHVYVDENKANPHNAGKVVPDCLRCHEEHALPAPAGTVKAAALYYCYTCHHDETFEACSSCH